MKYWAPINSPGGIHGNDGYVNGDPSLAIEGSIPTFQSFEQTLRGLQNLVAYSNRIPNAALNDLQITESVRAQWVNWVGIFGGTNVALSCVYNPAPATLNELIGMPIRGVGLLENPGPATLQVGGLAERPIVRTDRSPLIGGEILPGQIVELVFDGTVYQLLGGYSGGGTETGPTGPGNSATRHLILYVRTDGNDLNDGSANTPDKAFLTGQAAMNKAFSYGPGEFGCTIRFADGLYSGPVLTKPWQGPDITIESTSGVLGTPAGVHLTRAGGSPDYPSERGPGTVEVQGLNKITIRNVKISCTGGGGVNVNSLVTRPGSIMVVDNVEFGSAHAGHIVGGGYFDLLNYKISGGAQIHINVGSAASFARSLYRTVTIMNAVNIANFVWAATCASATIVGTNFVNKGFVSGNKFVVRYGGGIDTLGAGTNYLPGSAAGTIGPVGWYN